MLVVNRFRVPIPEASAFRQQLEHAHALLAAQQGYVDGTVGRNVDEPELWILTTRWVGPGAYRRALSAYDVKVEAWAVLGTRDRGAVGVRGGGAGAGSQRRAAPGNLAATGGYA